VFCRSELTGEPCSFHRKPVPRADDGTAWVLLMVAVLLLLAAAAVSLVL
jgi:hypothetical protein